MGAHPRAFAVALTGVAMLVALVGCVNDAVEAADRDRDRAQPAAAPAPVDPSAPVAEVERAARRIQAPRGFVADARGPWSVITSEDGKSRIAEGPLDPEGTIDVAVARAAAALGARDPVLAEAQTIALGAESIPALAGDGRCTLGDAEARIAYAVLDGGDGQRWLLVHVSARDLDEATGRAALGAIAALHRHDP